MTNNGAGGTITPTTTNQTVAAGYWSSANTVSGDADLVAANIKSGESIFAVTGSALVSSGTAVAADVLSGKTFSNSSSAGLSGAMTNNGAGGTITPTTTNQTVAAGYWSSANTVSGDANLVAANIKSGESIFAVTGSALVSSGTAVAADVLSGKTFSNTSSAGLSGAMTNNGAGGTITPTTTNQTVAAGYWSSAQYGIR